MAQKVRDVAHLVADETAPVADEAHPGANDAALLGKRHATYEALSRVEFFDVFHLNVDDVRDGYSATALWHLYLRSRLRARMQDW